ncbi:MAG: coproporphyrinogen III oxidase [Spirochaetae bacterium HGW-Spirochaetae-5]|nr:MAG: coproporphyrinogen III oxidase [Spirochaetae bacterium HGW-Spirochaetae-5]
MKSGIYIHIPFCRNKCDYCSFYSIPVNNNSDIIESYVEKLLKEIDHISGIYGRADADTIYFGGGTPSILKPGQVDKIISRISKNFDLGSDPEITIEMNPHDLLREKLKGFTQAGVNRITLGVQSLNTEMRKNIGRRGGVLTESDFELFFSHGGFIRCLDIMAGLPGQSRSLLLNDLERVTSYKPEHISLYLLSVDEDTPLGRRFNPDDNFDNLQADLWGDAMDFLSEKGYIHYEISNYALPGFESRHNSKYWDFTPFFGFGSGAHSFADGKRYSNKLQVSDYINNDEFLYDFEALTPESIIVEFFMTFLRRMKGFSSEEFISVTGVPIPDSVIAILNAFIIEEMIEITDGRYHLSKKGLFYTDSIIYRLTEQFL